jgi:hypothetical protein
MWDMLSPTRGEEGRREGMDIFIVRGAGSKPEWMITPNIDLIPYRRKPR